MAHYDLPAMLTAVLEETTEGDLMFVGHGVGTTAFLAMSHYRPDLALVLDITQIIRFTLSYSR